jgi:hypothetical protein
MGKSRECKYGRTSVLINSPQTRWRGYSEASSTTTFKPSCCRALAKTNPAIPPPEIKTSDRILAMRVKITKAKPLMARFMDF